MHAKKAAAVPVRMLELLQHSGSQLRHMLLFFAHAIVLCACYCQGTGLSTACNVPEVSSLAPELFIEGWMPGAGTYVLICMLLTA